MKKYKVFLYMLLTAILFSSCTAEKKQYPDYISGNPSDIYGNPIMETEDGFYTNLHSFNLSLCYYDKATGKAVFLCAKPECKHDGNKYCTATKQGVIYDGNICKSGEYVYYAASEYVPEDEKEYYKLIRAKADGTEFTELCTFQTTVNKGIMHSILGENHGRVLAVHRGYAVVPFYDFDLPADSSECTPNTMIIDIDSGSYKRLPTLDIDLTKTLYGQGDYFLYEDCLYYTVTTKEKLLYRYNLKSGITEKVDIPTVFTSYAVIDGCIYYSAPTKGETPSKLWKYDPESGTTADLSDRLMIDGKPFANANFLWNGAQFIIWDEHYWEGGSAVPKNHSDMIMIMDKDGNALAVYDMWNAPIPRRKNSSGEYLKYGLKSQNGKLYICTFLSPDDPRWGYDEDIRSLVLCCEISDIIEGKAKWYEPFDFYQLIKVTPHN